MLKFKYQGSENILKLARNGKRMGMDGDCIRSLNCLDSVALGVLMGGNIKIMEIQFD